MKCNAWALSIVFLAGLALELRAQTKPATTTTTTTTTVTDDAEKATVTKERRNVAYRPAGEPVVRLLRKKIEPVDWNETSFDDVIDWLRDQSEGEVNIIARWTPLGVENVTPESLITLQLRDVTVADVMDEVLVQLSEDGQVRYHGEQNTIRISSRSDFDRFLYVRIYDVKDILFRVPNFGQGAPQIDLQKSTGGGQGGGGGQSVFSGGSSGGGGQQEDSGQQADQRMEKELEELRDSIKVVIAPESWRDVPNVQGAGGGRGEIEVINRTLVVTNTIEVHEQIAGYFAFRD